MMISAYKNEINNKKSIQTRLQYLLLEVNNHKRKYKHNKKQPRRSRTTIKCTSLVPICTYIYIYNTYTE